MSISGVVITMSAPPGEREALLARIRGDERITLGETRSDRVPAVLETESHRGERECWDWLLALPGVSNVELACVLYPEAADSGKARER